MGKKSKNNKKGSKGAGKKQANNVCQVKAEATEHDNDEDLLNLLQALGPLGVHELSIVLGEMLFPTGNVEDITKWERNVPLIEGLRNLFLRKKYGDEPAYMQKLALTLDPDYLPSREELIELFGLKRPSVNEWSRAKADDHLQHKLALISEAPNGSVEHWTLEQKLESLGCAVVGRNCFNLCCEDTGRYEFHTKEFIAELAQYLDERMLKLDQKVILEVGAGSGALSHFLNARLKSIGSASRCIATDPDHRPAPRQRCGIAARDGMYQVECLDCTSALAKYNPAMVLCSWMPMDLDWSDAFRNYAEEYVLVGESDFGACGHNQLTWGKTFPGWSRVDLDFISKWQLQRYDSDEYSGNSVTISFRKATQEV